MNSKWVKEFKEEEGDDDGKQALGKALHLAVQVFLFCFCCFIFFLSSFLLLPFAI